VLTANGASATSAIAQPNLTFDATTFDVTGDAQVGRSSGNCFLTVKSGLCNVQLFKNGLLGGLYEADNGRMNLTTNGNTDNGITIRGGSSLVGINCNDPQFGLDVRSGNGINIVASAATQITMAQTDATKASKFYTDGSDFYLLVAATPAGGSNSLRPIRANLTTGFVAINSTGGTAPQVALDVFGDLRCNGGKSFTQIFSGTSGTVFTMTAGYSGYVMVTVRSTANNGVWICHIGCIGNGTMQTVVGGIAAGGIGITWSGLNLIMSGGGAQNYVGVWFNKTQGDS
jgi:hypothetical protein